MYAESTFLFECACADDPALRVAGVNRGLEGLACDVFRDTLDFAAQAGDPVMQQAVDKLVGVFEVLKPHLIEVYERHVRETDAIADAPSIEILEDIIRKTRRHVAWGLEVLDRLADTDARRERRRLRAARLTEQLRASGGVTGDLS
jgi:hypothetical protein